MPCEAIAVMLIILATAVTRLFFLKQISSRRNSTSGGVQRIQKQNHKDGRDATGVLVLASMFWFYSVFSILLMTLNYHLYGVITHDGGSLVAFIFTTPFAVVLTIAAITKPRWATTYF